MTRARRLGTAGAIAVGATAVVLVAIVSRPPVAAAARSSATGHRLVSGAVTFSLPERWLVQDWVRDLASEGVALFIPCAPLDRTPHSANVNLLAEPNADGEGLAAWSGRRLATAAPKLIVDDRVDGPWRTVLSTGEDRGARYLVVERFGVSDRARVHAVAAFPALDDVDPAWFDRTGAEIDRFLDSIALDGASPSSVAVAWDGRTLRLAGGVATR